MFNSTQLGDAEIAKSSKFDLKFSQI